jgi:hypothetical protein
MFSTTLKYIGVHIDFCNFTYPKYEPLVQLPKLVLLLLGYRVLQLRLEWLLCSLLGMVPFQNLVLKCQNMWSGHGHILNTVVSLH